MTNTTPTIIDSRRSYQSIISEESLVGFVFGKYTVIALEDPPFIDKSGRYIRRYICRCLCGKERAITAGRIKTRPPSQCNQCIKKNRSIIVAERINNTLPGNRLGRFTVISSERVGATIMWQLRCDCGELIQKTTRELHRSSVYGCAKCNTRIRKENLEAAALRDIHGRYKLNAKNRNIEFKLNQNLVAELITKPCYYCGVAHSNIFTYRKEKFLFNGIDRVDNSRGYLCNNVVPACKICNTAKRTMPKEHFIAMVTRIAKHLNLLKDEAQ